MDIESLRNRLRYKTDKTTLCLKDVSRDDHMMVYRLIKTYKGLVFVCCPQWSPWIKSDQAVSSECVVPHH